MVEFFVGRFTRAGCGYLRLRGGCGNPQKKACGFGTGLVEHGAGRARDENSLCG